MSSRRTFITHTAAAGVVTAASIQLGCVAVAADTWAARTAAPAADEIKIGTKHWLDSAILKEKRDYWVYLPPGYDDSLYAPVRYPIMYK